MTCTVPVPRRPIVKPPYTNSCAATKRQDSISASRGTSEVNWCEGTHGPAVEANVTPVAPTLDSDEELEPGGISRAEIWKQLLAACVCVPPVFIKFHC